MNSLIETKLTDTPKVSIGMPVYNGAQFISKALDSILAQTFQDFELIISDNVSTDSTSIICEEYAKKDKRIRYIRQHQNMGGIWNFNFVLQEARSEYFVWLSADDYWLPQFLEKNILILESDKNIVGCISKIKMYGKLKLKTFEISPDDSVLQKSYKKIRQHFSPYGIVSLYGSYDERARKFLKKGTGGMLYAVYRTDKLRKGMNLIVKDYIDSVVILTTLKYGNFHAIDEILMYRYAGGTSSGGFVHENIHKKSILDLISPWHPITFWCINHIGIKFFLRNLDYFIWYTFWGPISFTIEIFQIFKQKISQK